MNALYKNHTQLTSMFGFGAANTNDHEIFQVPK